MTYTMCSSLAELVEVHLVPDVEVQEPAQPQIAQRKDAVRKGSYEPAGPGKKSPAKAKRAEGTRCP